MFPGVYTKNIGLTLANNVYNMGTLARATSQCRVTVLGFAACLFAELLLLLLLCVFVFVCMCVCLLCC